MEACRILTSKQGLPINYNSIFASKLINFCSHFLQICHISFSTTKIEHDIITTSKHANILGGVFLYAYISDRS
jgi:hypothetical protein